MQHADCLWAVCYKSCYLDPVDERSKEEHKKLHGGHGLVEKLLLAVLIVLGGAAIRGLAGGALVLQLVNEGTAAP